MKLNKSISSFLLRLFLLFHFAPAHSDTLPEYRLKAVFLYNFIAFTEWPDYAGAVIQLCIYGDNPFGPEIGELNERRVNSRIIRVLLKRNGESLQECQALFIAKPEIGNLPVILNTLDSRPILTIADSKDAASRGVILNMQIANEKIIFEANLQAAQHAGLTLSSRLLRLAAKVYP